LDVSIVNIKQREIGMRKDGKIQKLQKEHAYLSARLEETAKELARLDLLNHTLTQQNRQAIAAFNFIKIMHEKVEKAFTIEGLYSNVVKSITSELFMDSAALLRIDFKNNGVTILASVGLPEDLEDLKLDRDISKEDSLEPTFISSKSTLQVFHKFIKDKFKFPYFVWYPITDEEDGTLVLFVGNKYENLIKKQPFSEAILETFGAIASAIYLRKDNIAKTQEMFRKKEEKIDFLAEILKTSPISVIATDGNARITYINPATEKLFGYTAEELRGKDPAMLKGKPNAAEIQKDILEMVRQGKVWRGEAINRKKNGDQFYTYTSIYQLLDKEGNFMALVGFQEDITEQKKAEEERTFLKEQLSLSQKMEAIGRLAGGIAHDFNNLLTIIEGYSQLSLIELKEGDPLRSNIEEIEKATRRASDLTRQFLAFSRHQVMEMKVLDLNTLLKDLEKMLRRIIGEDIELLTVLAEDLGRVKVDAGQIEQVIMNLAVNSRDAMPSGGKLTIETANVELDGAYAHRHIAVKPGRYVMLSVSDTGVGMTPQVKERVFEPFFTTKKATRGTGLGLSMVYGIVKQSGGNIWVYSEPGKGTTFKIYLPRIDQPPGEVKIKPVAKEFPRGNETILIVEDEEEVRKLAGKILRRQGYKLLEAPQGGDAFLICEQRTEQIHLLVTDVVMPRMSGPELAKRLRILHPEMKVLYMSGYTDNAIVHHGVLEKGVNFIQKPFTFDGLARKVREVLDKHS
jgi:PAS domain S-box-containing protein